MKIAFFTNFTSKPFTFYWNGKPYTVNPGQKKSMPEYLARHAAKHLANWYLLNIGKDGKSPITRDELTINEAYTSPKRPDDVPQFMEPFNKAFQLDPDGIEMDDAGFVDEGKRPVDPQIAKMLNSKAAPQVIAPKDADVEDEDGFEGANSNQE